MARKGEKARARSKALLTIAQSIVAFLQQRRASTVGLAQHLQLAGQPYVDPVVKLEESKMSAPCPPSNRRYVRVTPPTLHAGVGDALRQAFRLDGEIRTLTPFQDLLERLD
jgi:hypothetical protein